MGEAMRIKAREGDFIENHEGAIFDVKGLVHPTDEIVAFIRYFPNEEGERKKGKTAYQKVYSLSRRFVILKEKFPQYLIHDHVFDETLCEVPVQDVKKHHRPSERLQEIRESDRPDALESRVLQLTDLLAERANIQMENIGISGSLLVKLHKPSSDIDVIIYGSENCLNVRSTLADLFKDKNSPVRPYNEKGLRGLFDFRSKDTLMSFESFVRIESNKMMQGKFLDTDYFVRFVKDWNEVDEKYGDVQYKNMGHARIEATVIDDSQAIFTPCSYRIEDTVFLEGPEFGPVTEVTSFRGRFCEQAKVGERIVARGKIEHVHDRRDSSEHYRLLVGNNYEDFLVPQVNGLFLSK